MAIQNYPTGERWEEIVKCTDERRQSHLICNYIADLQTEINAHLKTIQDYINQIEQLRKDFNALAKATKDSSKNIVIQMQPKDILLAMKQYGEDRADKAKKEADDYAYRSLQDYVFNGGC